MLRWCLVLECSHHLLSDDPAVTGDREYCPACGFTFPVLESFIHHEELQ